MAGVQTKSMSKKNGFTLIELLIVIVIIGILAAIVVANFYGARQRALDSQKKSRLNQLSIALQSFYANYHKYPWSTQNNGINFYACGTGGTQLCTTSFTADNIEYMGKLPKTVSGQNDFRYYVCLSGDDYRLKINLSNSSDLDILESQAKCPPCGTTYGATDYVLCSD